MHLLGVDFLKKSGTLLQFVSNSLDPDQAHHPDRPDLDSNCLKKVVTSKERAGEESIFEKKMKIQIVAIYMVDVQTGINVINLLSRMLNSIEYGIYPAHNVKMQQLLAF